MAKVLARRAVRSKLYPAVFAFSLLAAPGLQAGELSQADVGTYRSAITAANKGRSAEAVRSVRRTQSDIGKDVVQWFALQNGNIDASFSTYADFISQHPDWPRCIEIDSKNQCDLLRKQAELRVSSFDDAGRVIEHFAANPPLTMRGLSAYADALDKNGRSDESETAIKTFWVNGSLKPDEQKNYIDQYGRLIKESDREARVDRLLWDGSADSARELIPTLSNEGFKAMAMARIGLQKDWGNAATLVEAVPSSHERDPGLAYDRARRLAAKDNEEAAARILIAHGPATNGKPNAWWKLRERVARELLAQGDSKRAYQVASEHGLAIKDDQAYRDAEWTSGWIALRFTGDAGKAAQHFKNMYDASVSVITRARGSYWLGRSAQALGQDDTSKKWYEVASQFGTTFYGQAAAHELYPDILIQPPTTPTPERSVRTAFNNRDMVKAVRMGVELHNQSIAKAFLNALADSSKSQDDATLTVELGDELHRPDLAAWAAKRVGRLGYSVPADAYPTLHFTIPNQPEAALIHSITRQESTFYTQARSPANAQGLMQLLPTTAAQVAKQNGIPYQAAWLLTKPDQNVRLGSAYLQSRIDAYSGSYVMAIASYNGGGGNVGKWRTRYGDPGHLIIPTAAKEGEPEMWGRIDWMELIPFSETREYVNYVLAGTEVYRAVLNKGSTPAHLRLKNNLER